MTTKPQDLRRFPVCSLTGKDRPTKSGAKSEAKRLERHTHAKVTAFECRGCGGWHVGKPKAKPAARYAA